MASQDSSFWVEAVKFFGQAVVVILGWVVVNKLAIERERDKARREMAVKTADGLCDSVDKLFEDARTYHSSHRDIKLEMKLKMSLKDFSQRVASLLQITQNRGELIKCLSGVVALRQSITAKHFEDEHNEPIEDAPIYEGIAEATLEMKLSLVCLKHAQFPLA